MSSVTMAAVQIWLMTAFSLVPMKLLIFRFCLIFLKKSSICQRSLYSAAICSGFKSIVGQEVKPAVVVCVVPLNDSKLKLAASFSSGRTIEFKLVIAIVVTLAAAPLLQRRRYGIVLEASDECSASLREPGKERVVVVAAIHNDRYVGGRQFLDGCLCQCGIVYLSGSQIPYARH